MSQDEQWPATWSKAWWNEMLKHLSRWPTVVAGIVAILIGAYFALRH